MKPLNFNDTYRLRIFKDEILDNDNLKDFRGFEDKILLDILNAAVLPNALSITAVKHAVLFNFIFQDSSEKRKKYISDFNFFYSFVNNLSKTEKVIIKYGVIARFSSNSWRSEFFKFLKTPLGLRKESFGNKSMSQKKFKEYYFFAKKLVSRGIKNERLPRF